MQAASAPAGDGMVVVIAVNDKDFYNHKKFNAWRHLGDRLSSLKISYPQDGEIIEKNIVDSIFSEAHLYNISKDRINKKFVLEEVVPHDVNLQKQWVATHVDSNTGNEIESTIF